MALNFSSMEEVTEEEFEQARDDWARKKDEFDLLVPNFMFSDSLIEKDILVTTDMSRALEKIYEKWQLNKAALDPIQSAFYNGFLLGFRYHEKRQELLDK